MIAIFDQIWLDLIEEADSRIDNIVAPRIRHEVEQIRKLDSLILRSASLLRLQTNR
jgi:hypothetical protein